MVLSAAQLNRKPRKPKRSEWDDLQFLAGKKFRHRLTENTHAAEKRINRRIARKAGQHANATKERE